MDGLRRSLNCPGQEDTGSPKANHFFLPYVRLAQTPNHPLGLQVQGWEDRVDNSHPNIRSHQGSRLFSHLVLGMQLVEIYISLVLHRHFLILQGQSTVDQESSHCQHRDHQDGQFHRPLILRTGVLIGHHFLSHNPIMVAVSSSQPRVNHHQLTLHTEVQLLETEAHKTQGKATCHRLQGLGLQSDLRHFYQETKVNVKLL